MMMMGLFSGISEDVANFFRDFLWKLIEAEIDCVRNLINALVLVDDEMNTLYAVQFDKRSNSWDKKFVWNGDDDNRDYHDESIKYSYLYIVDKEEYDNQKYLKEIEDTPTDDIDPEINY